MTKARNNYYFSASLNIPGHLMPRVMDTPRLLPGECREEFFLFFEVAAGELAPTSDLEWLLCIDLAWIMWDIQRYRHWKDALIVTKQSDAMREAVRRCDPVLSVQEPGPGVLTQARRKMDATGGESAKIDQLIAPLEKAGYDPVSLNALTFLESAADIATIEKFLVSAIDQFNRTLRGAAVRREFKLRAEKARMELDQAKLAQTMRIEKNQGEGRNVQ